MPSFEVFGMKDCGKIRENNEDNYLISPDQRFIAVCDGIGGYKGGEIASQITCETLLQAWREAPVLQASNIPLWIDKSLRFAQYKMGQVPKCRNMGSTFVGAIRIADVVHISHLGDSRAYRLRQGRLLQTKDHANHDTGVLEHCLEKFPHMNRRINKIGFDNCLAELQAKGKRLPISHRRLTCLPGDRFLFCSDGLHGYVSKRAIKTVLQESVNQGWSAKTVCQKLIELAYNKGAPDNITVVVVNVNV